MQINLYFASLMWRQSVGMCRVGRAYIREIYKEAVTLHKVRLMRANKCE